MRTLYIKFKNENDVYAIDEFYDLSPDGFVIPKVCSRCGDNLYIPVEMPENSVIDKPMGNVIKPFPLEKPNFVIFDEPDLPVLAIHATKTFSVHEQNRLRNYPGVIHVDSNSFEMLIEDISTKPVVHKCADLAEDQ